MDSSQTKSRPNPREKANSLSVLVWWWTIGIFKKGYSKVLTIKDLFDPLQTDRSSLLGDRIEKQWNKELNRAQKLNRQPSLMKTMFLTFSCEIFLLGVLHALVELVLKLGSPILLGRLLQYFKPQTTSTYEDALIYAGALTLVNIFTFILGNHLLFMGHHLGGQVRISLSSLIYRKALRLSKTALGETAPGKIVNLVANDVNRFDLLLIFLHTMWSAPVSCCIVAYILYTEAKFAALIGTAVLFTVAPIQMFNGKLSSKYRLQTALKTDERVRLMDEIISGVQVIKMYAWEKPFCTLVEMARRLELKVIRKSSYLRGLFMTFFVFTTRCALYCTLVSMLMFGELLSADKIFVFASFYNVISHSMTSMFVRGFAELAECKVSVNRIQSFLMLDEFREVIGDQPTNLQNSIMKEMENNMILNDVYKINGMDKVDRITPTESYYIDNNDLPDEPIYSVQLDHLTAKWYPELSENTLEDIDVKIEKGKLYAVIGMVGSGKSSLLSSILGEINIVEGSIKTKGKISYVEQDAWIFGSSVRQNILFGEEFDKQKYQRVVNACSLFKDFAQLPEGDDTVVGERGSSLSGGQKARINLARAVYRQADIYLLDDPLSAVDAHVGKHLFEECIRRYLFGKTRILATHQLQFIKDVDGIILLDQGKMQYYENYHKLLEAYPEYGSLIAAEKEQNSTEDITIEKTEIRRRVSSSKSKSRISVCEDAVEIVKKNENTRKLEDIMEASSKGIVKGVFCKYIQAGSTICTAFILFVLFTCTQVLVSLNDLYVPYIVTAEESRHLAQTLKNDTDALFSATNRSKVVIPESELLPTQIYIYIYSAIVFSIFIVGLTRSFIYYNCCMRSSERLHNSAFSALIRTDMHFFDTNPSGRILNRFSKDMTSIDEHLPKALFDCAQSLLLIAGALIVTCTVNYMFLAPTLVIAVVCYSIRTIYLKTSKNIKRLEGMTRSPVFTHLNATLTGISTIRAYQAQDVLKYEFDKFQDVHTSSWYIYIACSLAYGFALDLFTCSLTSLIIFSFLIFKNQFNGGEVGLAITQMMAIATRVQWGMRQSAEVTNQLMSVERVLEYTQIPPEKNLREINLAGKAKKKRGKETALMVPLVVPPKDWPSRGTVEFKNVYMRYNEEDEPVLKDLSFFIKPTEKVGIVGRTGAGKSSIIAALFRLAHLDGVIAIDGIDTSTIALEDLRSRISIIPQDPVLFSGTLRRNLDPFNEFPDKALWEALEEVEMKDAIITSGTGLHFRILDRGSNLSVGQRQLICLARAVLRNNRVLMLDEATANVDPQTDALIQRTIRTKFAKCTVLTVAHRLNTIMDGDKVIVMDRGHLAEFDHPYNLLQKKNGQFTSLVKETGDAMFEQFYNMAKQYYDEKNNISS